MGFRMKGRCRKSQLEDEFAESCKLIKCERRKKSRVYSIVILHP